MSFLEFKNLSKSFRDLSVLNDISLNLESGEFVSVIGASGSGKSTLLRIIAGLEKPSAGEVKFSHSPLLSFVFQDPCLLPWKTAEENIRLPFELLKTREKNLDQVIELVGLTPYKKYYPHELSGGMRMRVSIARALVTEPEIMLLDEPFAALDEVTRFQLQDELIGICDKRKMSVVFVTHSISEAVYMSNRVLVLDKKSRKLGNEVKIEEKLIRNQDFKNTVQYRNYVTKLSANLKGDE